LTAGSRAKLSGRVLEVPAARERGLRAWLLRPALSAGIVFRATLAVLVIATLAAPVTRLRAEMSGVDDALGHASLPWLAGAGAAETVCYLALAGMIGRLLGHGPGLSRFVALRLSVVIYGLGSVLPGSPAPGLAMATAELRSRGVPVARFATAFFWCVWFNLRGFLVLAALTSTMVTLRGLVPSGSAGIVLGAALLVLAGLTLTTALAGC